MKFTANEILKSIIKEYSNYEDMNSIYKALIAYSLGLEIIDEEIDKILDKVIEEYYENDNISNFINSDIIDYANELLEK